MKPKLRVNLQAQLNKFLKIPAPPYLPQRQKNTSSDLIDLGYFSLKETPDMIARFFEFLSKELICIDDFEGFKKAFSRDIKKPKYPLENDPYFKNNPYPEGTQYHKSWHTWAFRDEVKTYYQKLSKYKAHENQKKIFYEPFFKDQKGYIESSEAKLYTTFPDTEQGFFDQPRQFYMKENDRKEHSYFCGATGSGKTTLIQTLIYHYLTHPQKTSVVVLDPHADFSNEVKLFKNFLNDDRLVYIDPFLHDPDNPQFLPSINPFDVQEKSEFAIDKAISDLVEILIPIFHSELTGNMKVILKKCLRVLILMKNRTLEDLLYFMTDQTNKEYINFALNNLKGDDLFFFQYDFHDKITYGQTKKGIKSRLQELFDTTIFKKFLTGSPSFDLESLVNQGKIIIFNLAVGKLGSDLSDVMGKFIIAKVKQIAFKREKIPKEKRVPCHLFLDEGHRYVTENIREILQETRKFGLYLTFSSQLYMEGFDPRLRRIVESNTKIKISGYLGLESRRKIAREFRVPEKFFSSLLKGRFLYSCRTEQELPTFFIQTSNFLLPKFGGGKFFMNDDEWETVKAKQLKKYYRPINPPKTPKNGKFVNVQRGARTPPNSTEDL